MKRITLIILFFISSISIVFSQTNYFPTSGSVGIGTTSPGTSLTIVTSYGGINISGSSPSWVGSDILVSRSSSGNYLQRSPNIALADVATGTSSIIQSYQGNLQFFANGTQVLNILTSGNSGFQTTAPYSIVQVESGSSKLCVGDANSSNLNNGTSYIGFNAARIDATSSWRMDSNGTYDGGGVIFGDISGNINFAPLPSLNGSGYYSLTDAQLASYTCFQLTAAGVTRAKQIVVQTTGWPDYVFKKNYTLLPLPDVAKFITLNHRLPDMPSAEDVAKTGLNLGETDKVLTKKIEELTLYLIDKDKQLNEEKETISQQQKQIDAQQQQFKAQEERIEKLAEAIEKLTAASAPTTVHN